MYNVGGGACPFFPNKISCFYGLPLNIIHILDWNIYSKIDTSLYLHVDAYSFMMLLMNSANLKRPQDLINYTSDDYGKQGNLPTRYLDIQTNPLIRPSLLITCS